MGNRKCWTLWKKIALLSFVIVLLVLVFFLRSQYVSGLLETAILPEIQAATGYRVSADEFLVNLFPPSLEVRGISVFDREGGVFFSAGRVKAYVGFMNIFRGVVNVRVVLIRPEFRTDRARLEEIRENIRDYSGRGEKRLLLFRVKAVAMKDAALSFESGESRYLVTADGADGELILKESPEARFSSRNLVFDFADRPTVKAGVEGHVILSGNMVEIERIRFSSYGSELSAKGTITRGVDADLTIDATILVSSVKEVMSLKKSGEGSIRARGKVELSAKEREPFIDLKLGGDFPLETLIEAVAPRTRHALGGQVSFRGKLSGAVSDLTGNANAHIDDGNLFGIVLEEADCRVGYEEKVLSFTEGKARLYNGRADVDVSLTLPRARPYSVDVVFKDADSEPALALIGVDWLKLSDGKVEGELHTSGMRFAPEGEVVYRSSESGQNILQRVEAVNGNYRLEDGLLHLTGFRVKSSLSSMAFDGDLDLSRRELNLEGRLDTSELNDIFAPHVNNLSGSGEVEGTVTGTFDEPLVNGKAVLKEVSLGGYVFGGVGGEFSYRKEIFIVEHANAESGDKSHDVKGSVRFPDAEKLFDMKSPAYDVSVSVENGELEELARAVGIDASLKGGFDANVQIRGNGHNPIFGGHAQVSSAEVYGRPISSGVLDFFYDLIRFQLKNASFTTDESRVLLEGAVSREGEFEFEAYSEDLPLNKLSVRELPLGYAMKLKAAGAGTFLNPEIRADISLTKGTFKGVPVGGGRVEAVLRGRELSVEAKLMDGNVSVSGSATLEGDIPWSAEVDMGQGRYDFLLLPLLKKVPEDLLLSLRGSASLHGNRDNINVSAVLPRMNLSLFGQGFTNMSDVVFSFRNRSFALSEVEFRSGSTFVKVGGVVTLDAFYELSFEGSSSLALLSGFIEKVEAARGNADFVFTLQGDWDNPTLNGGLSISDGMLALKGLPQRFSSLDAYLYVEDDRLVIRNLSSKFGGGNIDATGVVYLEGVGVEKFLVSAIVDNVSVSLSRDFNLNIGGELVLKGTAESQSITGDLQINRASYKKRVEWKSWMLFRQKKKPKVEKGLIDRVKLNVRINGTENILVDNNIARAPLKVDMIVGGTVNSPRLFGRIETDTGKVYFRNSVFNILSATADFVDPESNRPIIRILAETSVKGHHIWLTLDGRIEQFDLTLSSDPPLDEVEILALLTLGDFGERLEGIEGGIGAAEAASFLTGRIQDVLEERVTDITGLDRVQIDPYISGSSENVSPRITVSKRLMGERLFVTFSSVVGGEVEQEFKLEYFLGENVVLQGEQDNRGSMGVDVKFRFRFK